mgnify:CR=1 FL=1
MKSDISVVIPLYNKEKEIARTLRSVLAQTSQPLEIIVVDDGSTDGSAARVEEIGSPLIRLIQQENRGVSAARNRAMQEACGEYAALLDGDDTWEPGYLAEIERLIAAYPGCGAYATSFNVDDGHHLTPGDTPQTEGVVDFFTEALSHYVLIPSSTTLRREPALSLGGFPEGMRMGEDQYLWTKLARTSPVCFSPARLVRYSKAASNRSAAIYRPEQTRFSFEDLYEQRIRRPRGTGQGPRRQRQRRHGGSRPGCEILRLHPARPAYAAQAPHPQRTARPLARSAARGLQPSGLGDRPERDVTKRRDATAEAPADSRTKPPTTVLRRTKKSRHREMPGSSLCAKRKTTPLPPRPSWRYRRSLRRRPPPNARSASRRPHAPRREAPWYP